MKRSLLLAGLAAVLCTTSAQAAHDNFHRKNLGKNWVVTSGSLFITNFQLQGTTGSLGSFTPSANDATVAAKVYTTSTDLEYGAVAIGNIGGGNNAFVKIQAQDGSGNFTNGAFYTGNNGSGNFFALNSPVPSPATLSVSLCGTKATMRIKSSAGTQVYKYDYTGTNFGTGGGLGTYGLVAFSHYVSKTAGCGLPEAGTTITHSNAVDMSLSK